MSVYYEYSCDGGSLALGNKDGIYHYMNQYGDGTHRVYIKEKGNSFPFLDDKTSFNDVYHFEGGVNGTFNLYSYDCLSKNDRENPEYILETLTGRFAIYSIRHSGHMLLERLED